MKYTWILGTLTLLCANAWLTEAAEPVPWRLSTNEPSFFFSDHRTGASYYRFDPDGNYVLIAKEHMGVWPLLGGSWIQDTNGTVVVTATNARLAGRAPDKIVPLSYKGQVFLVWPEKSYASNVAKVMERIDSGTNRLHVYNEFQISGAEFTNATAKPYPFKYRK